ncbi:MAG TPA: hypothetical protein VGA73_03560 [Candidatus Binatia bacterium]
MPGQTWTAVIRCCVCGETFTLSHIATGEIGAALAETRCSHCSAISVIGHNPPYVMEGKLHLLVNLMPEPENPLA